VIVAFTIDNNPDRYEKVKKDLERKNKIWMKKRNDIFARHIDTKQNTTEKIKEEYKMCKETLEKESC